MNPRSFEPIADQRAQRLILGSMPGKASLRARQYYALPRNCFWGVIAELLGMPSDLPYEERCVRLMNERIALWDVLRTCERASSLDSDIIASSIVTNDFVTFLTGHPHIEIIYFNGIKAGQIYRQRVLPMLPETLRNIPGIVLPSTSPANAALSYQDKLAKWRVIMKPPV